MTHDLFEILKELPPKVCPDGTRIWFNKDGEIHRDCDMPAVIHKSGHTTWYQYGSIHRENDQPAIIWENGAKDWYLEGELIHSILP